MMKMGFAEDVLSVYEKTCPMQVLLYTATAGEHTEKLASSLLHDALRIDVKEETVRKHTAAHFCLFVPAGLKKEALKKIISESRARQILLFCDTRDRSDQLCGWLRECGFTAGAVHSEMDPSVRQSVMRQYRAGQIRILCATDVAARGIDQKTTDLVIQYEFPSDPDVFLHRSGRTGRGIDGTVITFLDKTQKDVPEKIFRLTGQKPEVISLPLSQEKKKNPRRSRRR